MFETCFHGAPIKVIHLLLVSRFSIDLLTLRVSRFHLFNASTALGFLGNNHCGAV